MKQLTSWSDGGCMVALSVSVLVSRVNFGLGQLKKGKKCRQHGFRTQFCGRAGYSVHAAISMHVCLQQPECFSSV